jgi:hypothetical protein
MKIIAVAFALLTLSCITLSVAAQAPQPALPEAPAPPPAREIQAGETRLQFYGFLRTDIIYDDSRPDSAQSPLFINSERPGAENQANFTLHPRLSRLGINFAGPSLAGIGGARLAGKLEIDFQNGGRESRATPRFRHAYATLAWPSVTLLVGNTWDLISPLFPSVNADTLMWNAGNIGDRRPQIRVTMQPHADKLQWSLAAAAGLTGAVDQQDLDNDTIRDGEAAGVPNLQGRAGLSWPVGSRRAGVGLSTHWARMKVSTPIGGNTEFDSHSLGADLEFPLGRRAMLRGEAWTGENLSDFRGGIGQAVNRTTGETIASSGGWTELAFDVTSRYAASVGYTVDTPRREDLPAGARSRNGAWFITNRWTVKPVVVGIDYLHWTTEYLGLPEGTDNRFNAYVVYSF